MSKNVCPICGYVYDDDLEKTKFSDLSDDYVCPMCGVPKEMFELKEDNDKKEEKDEIEKNQDNLAFKNEELKELSDDELEIIFSSLSKGSEKQYNLTDAKIFKELSELFKKNHNFKEKDSIKLIDKALKTNQKAFSIASENKDRGALRALTWSEKVHYIQKNILNSYNKFGINYFKDKKIYVCTICGFIYIGNSAPEICPVCKVPSEKIVEVL